MRRGSDRRWAARGILLIAVAQLVFAGRNAEVGDWWDVFLYFFGCIGFVVSARAAREGGPANGSARMAAGFGLASLVHALRLMPGPFRTENPFLYASLLLLAGTSTLAWGSLRWSQGPISYRRVGQRSMSWGAALVGGASGMFIVLNLALERNFALNVVTLLAQFVGAALLAANLPRGTREPSGPGGVRNSPVRSDPVRGPLGQP